MKDYTALCRVTYDYDGEEICKAIILYGNTFTEIGEQIDKLYGDDAYSVDINMFYTSVAEFDINLYDILKKNIEENI